MIDFLALKMGLETFEADAVDAYCQAPEHKNVVVEPESEYLERITAGRETSIVATTTTSIGGKCAAGQSQVEHLGRTLVNKSVIDRCSTAPVLLECNATRCIVIAYGRHSWCSDSEWTRTIHQRNPN